MFGVVVSWLGIGEFLGASFDDRAGWLERSLAGLAAQQLGGDIELFFRLLVFRLLGARHRLLHFKFQLRDHRAGAGVTHRGMLAGVGLDLRAVDTDGADFGEAQVLGQLQHYDERPP